MNTSSNGSSPDERDISTVSSCLQAGGAAGRIGPYHLLDTLGEGGFGVVYLAEQHQPIRRRVAVKLIKPGMASADVISRFEAERQALALMDHPSLAKVLDAGTTDDGQPYFVMEYVPGQPITKHCDAEHLSIEARLSLFLQVCEAVQHAHQRGIIHRDLKPRNILVSVHDGQAVPKVIDFGVAKAVNQPLTERTLYTGIGQLIGTPAYMSPEQAEMKTHDIDTRTDIYSLGVLLYELLTGALPLDPELLKKAAFEELLHTIREVEPAKPSTRIMTIAMAKDDADTKSRNRDTDLRTWGKEVRGDLDWITMKALEKDRARRYSSASALAADVRRHLENEPVVAGPPDAAYRLCKFARRHRVTATTTGIIAAVLVVATAVSVTQATRATRAERLAEKRLAESRIQTARANEVIGFLQEMLASVDPEVSGHDVRVMELLDEAAVELQGNRVSDEEVKATLQATLGATYLSLMELDKAEVQLHEAMAAQERLLGSNDPAVADSLERLAWLTKEQGNLEKAEWMYERCIAIQEHNYDAHDPKLATSKHHMGIVLMELGSLNRAERFMNEAEESLRLVRGEDDPDRATVLTSLGQLLCKRGEYEEAAKPMQEALRIYRTAYGKDHVAVARALANLASLDLRMKRFDDAEVYARQALEIRRHNYGDCHSTVASSLVTLGTILSRQGQYDEAEPLLMEASQIYREIHGDSHSYVAGTMFRIAELEDERGDHERAAETFAQVIDMYVSVDGPDHWHVANARSRYGLCLMDLGRVGEAEKQLLAAEKSIANTGFDQVWRVTAERLAMLYETTGDEDAARKWRGVSAAIDVADAK